MHPFFLFEEFGKNKNREALIWKDKSFTYGNILHTTDQWKSKLLQTGIFGKHSVVALKGDFSPVCISILLSLIEANCIIVPLNYRGKDNNQQFSELSEAEFIISVNENDEASITGTGRKSSHEFYKELREKNHPGLVMFSSGTTGEPKAAVHDFILLLEKFRTKRAALRTLNFLLFDHWGGLNTMFHTLSNGGTTISVDKRTPENICGLIEKYKIELLPASPTFLNLILISEAYKRFDVSSLKVISYGTEPMPESTLKKLNNVFPSVKFHQTYGLIETGVMRTKSKDNDSLWVKLGGEGFETRVVENMLQIKSNSSILGYLNYPSPFTDDGWFITGDEVETDGEYFKILGRKSGLINVGGEKVYPAEVESVIKEIDDVEEVRVYGEKNPLTGNIVCAEISIKSGADLKELKSEIKKHCFKKLPGFKVPVKIKFTEKINHSERFKKRIC